MMNSKMAIMILAYAGFSASALASTPPPPSDHEEPTPPEPAHIDYGLSTSHDKIIEAETNYGVVTLDFETNRIYRSTSNGIAEYSLSSALTAAGYDAYTIMNDVNTFSRVSDFVFLRDDDGPGFMGPCDLSPCVETYDPVSDRYVYTPPFNPYSDPNMNTDIHLVEDKNAFENWREGQCDSALESGIESSFEAPAVGVSCAAWETGIGAFVCAGGLGKQAYDAFKRGTALTDCQSSYPGPGAWEGSTLPPDYEP